MEPENDARRGPAGQLRRFPEVPFLIEHHHASKPITRILITGGAGFIGSNLALHLVSAGHTVTVLDNLSPQVHSADAENSPLYRSIKGKVEFVRGSVVDVDTLQRVIPSQDVLVHLAAGRFESMDSESGELLTPAPTDEDSRLHPSSVYGITKHAQEQLIMTTCPAVDTEDRVSPCRVPIREYCRYFTTSSCRASLSTSSGSRTNPSLDAVVKSFGSRRTRNIALSIFASGALGSDNALKFALGTGGVDSVGSGRTRLRLRLANRS